MSPASRKRSARAQLLGLGLDNTDGHVRVTQGENFSLFSGSQETHELMQRQCIKLNEKLARKGKRLEEASREEVRDLLGELD